MLRERPRLSVSILLQFRITDDMHFDINLETKRPITGPMKWMIGSDNENYTKYICGRFRKLIGIIQLVFIVWLIFWAVYNIYNPTLTYFTPHFYTSIYLICHSTLHLIFVFKKSDGPYIEGGKVYFPLLLPCVPYSVSNNRRPIKMKTVRNTQYSRFKVFWKGSADLI
mgnify:CR=1 FL=1